jgi:hypothetical protein
MRGAGGFSLGGRSGATALPTGIDAGSTAPANPTIRLPEPSPAPIGAVIPGQVTGAIGSTVAGANDAAAGA